MNNKMIQRKSYESTMLYMRSKKKNEAFSVSSSRSSFVRGRFLFQFAGQSVAFPISAVQRGLRCPGDAALRSGTQENTMRLVVSLLFASALVGEATDIATGRWEGSIQIPDVNRN
jgi:hypothetical protein